MCEKQEQQSSLPPAPGPENQPPLDDKKKNALLRYMGILFAFAFLMVLLSFLIQLRNSRLTISELNQASANALQNAEALQDLNRELLDKNSALSEEIGQLEDSVADKDRQLEARKSQLESMGDQLKRVEEQRIQDQQDAEKRLEAYELLSAAQQAAACRDTKTLEESLKSLSELSQYLEENGMQLYQSLLAEN